MTRGEVFGQRLKSARIMRGLSIKALSNVTGVSCTDISKYEKSHKAPDSTTVLTFADALNQSVDYFFHPLNVRIDYVKFRKKSTLSKADEDSIKGQVIDFAERYMDVESLYYVQDAVSLPKYNVATNEDAQCAAKELRTKWHLGNDGIVSIISMMEDNFPRECAMLLQMSFCYPLSRLLR